LCGLVIGLRACAVWRPETRRRTAFAAGSELPLSDLLGDLLGSALLVGAVLVCAVVADQAPGCWPVSSGLLVPAGPAVERRRVARA
jgi:hypothetical protein